MYQYCRYREMRASRVFLVVPSERRLSRFTIGMYPLFLPRLAYDKDSRCWPQHAPDPQRPGVLACLDRVRVKEAVKNGTFRYLPTI